MRTDGRHFLKDFYSKNLSLIYDSGMCVHCNYDGTRKKLTESKLYIFVLLFQADMDLIEMMQQSQ